MRLILVLVGHILIFSVLAEDNEPFPSAYRNKHTRTGASKETLLEVSDDKEEAVEILDDEEKSAVPSYIKMQEHVFRVALG